MSLATPIVGSRGVQDQSQPLPTQTHIPGAAPEITPTATVLLALTSLVPTSTLTAQPEIVGEQTTTVARETPATLTPLPVSVISPTPTRTPFPNDAPTLVVLEFDNRNVFDQENLYETVRPEEKVEIKLRGQDEDGNLLYLALVDEDGDIIDKADCGLQRGSRCTMTLKIEASSKVGRVITFGAIAVDDRGASSKEISMSIETKRVSSGGGGGGGGTAPPTSNESPTATPESTPGAGTPTLTTTPPIGTTTPTGTPSVTVTPEPTATPTPTFTPTPSLPTFTPTATRTPFPTPTPIPGGQFSSVVDFRLIPDDLTVAPDEEFTIDIVVEPNDQEVTFVQVVLLFDPNALKALSSVLDQYSPLDTLLVPNDQFDNDLGIILLSSGPNQSISEAPSTLFTFGNVTFRARDVNETTNIEFQRFGDPRTFAGIAGFEVTDGLFDAEITISPPPPPPTSTSTPTP